MTIKKYVIISPCRDEAAFMLNTLESIVAQTVKPSLWVIVDDGSTDKTPEILAGYAAKYDFIRIIKNEDRGHRKVGPGVIEAFYAGYSTVDMSKYDYICKLDLDLTIPPRYFEILLTRLEENPRIGTCSGKPYFVDVKNGKLVSEKCGDENSVGMTKLFRKICFEQIGGFVQEVMWDGIDGHRCRMLGWIACSWDEPELRFIHLRPMGSSQRSIITGRIRHGYGQYFMGTDFFYMTASAIYRMTRPPLLIGGLAMWWGYLQSMLSRKKRMEDVEFRKFLRKYQWSSLLKGKKRTTAALNKQGGHRWGVSLPGNKPSTN